MSKIKKHPFFDKIDWSAAYEQELKMPKIIPRKIVKSDLPYNFNGDSDDEDYFEDRK